MIVLNKDSWFVKYWIRWGCTDRGFEKLLNGYKTFIWDDKERQKLFEKTGSSYRYIPPGTNLCQLARINIYALLKTFGVMFLLGGLFNFMISNPSAFLGIVIMVGGGIGSGVFVSWMIKGAHSHFKGKVKFKDTLPVQYYKAWKGKFCPRISFTGTPSDSIS